MKTKSSSKIARSPALTWSHCGIVHRVTTWPDVAFTRQIDGEDVAYAPDSSSDAFASAAVMLDRAAWNRFLEFVPARERQFVEQFKIGRMAALAVITQCPALLE